MTKNSIFDFEHSGDTLILIPNTDLRELEFDTLEAGSDEVFQALDSETINNVIIDFHKTDYYGSTALAFFVPPQKNLWVKSG
ncbi:MAG: hypothetical protein QGG71_27350 [Pirellulaceae bacterium]|nr:hypothetical protein [Pirellulaceae bacterium]